MKILRQNILTMRYLFLLLLLPVVPVMDQNAVIMVHRFDSTGQK